jgi:ABC-type multidrug transport system permease subunit
MRDNHLVSLVNLAEVMRMKDWMFGLAALILAILAFLSFRQYQGSGSVGMFWLTIILVLLTIASAATFLVKKLSKKEEIHITQ